MLKGNHSVFTLPERIPFGEVGTFQSGRSGLSLEDKVFSRLSAGDSVSQVIACPHCDKKLTLRDELKGRPLICPKCKGRFTAPADEPEPQEPAADVFSTIADESPSSGGSDMTFSTTWVVWRGLSRQPPPRPRLPLQVRRRAVRDMTFLDDLGGAPGPAVAVPTAVPVAAKAATKTSTASRAATPVRATVAAKAAAASSSPGGSDMTFLTTWVATRGLPRQCPPRCPWWRRLPRKLPLSAGPRPRPRHRRGTSGGGVPRCFGPGRPDLKPGNKEKERSEDADLYRRRDCGCRGGRRPDCRGPVVWKRRRGRQKKTRTSSSTSR